MAPRSRPVYSAEAVGAPLTETAVALPGLMTQIVVRECYLAAAAAAMSGPSRSGSVISHNRIQRS